jgi:hypothetical protein
MCQRGIIRDVSREVREALEGQMAGGEVQDIKSRLALQTVTQEVAHIVPEVVVGQVQ